MSEPAEPVSKRRALTRAKLLDAAADLLGEAGIDAVSVEEICERAGFTRGAFYSNFESKGELFQALVNEFLDRKIDAITERVGQLTSVAGGGVEEIARHITAVVTQSRRDTIIVNEFRTHALRDPELAAAYTAWQRAVIERVGAVIAEIATVSGLRLRLDPLDLARLLLGLGSTSLTDAAVAGIDIDEATAVLRDRTAVLALALVEPAPSPADGADRVG